MKIVKSGIVVFIICFHALSVFAQKEIPLYPAGKVPNSLPGAQMPTIKVYEPNKAKRTHTAMIICSGGSYHRVADPAEGTPAAELFSQEGIRVFVLDYRVPRSDMMVDKEMGPIEDLQTAIKYVREHVKEYDIAPDHIGIMGFSAGGHLVSTAGTHFDKNYITNPEGTSLRPDFMVLVYPVVSFSDDLTHLVSRDNLIGPIIRPEKIMEYSNELHVNHQTPPTFITVSLDDDVVKPANALGFAAALEQANVASKLFIYKRGGHGYGVANSTAVVQWTQSCIDWIRNGEWAKVP